MTADSGFQTSEDVLERMRRELERISERQHGLTRCKAVLQDLATQLRCGQSSVLLNVVLREAAASNVIDALERSYRCDCSVEELARQVTGPGRT